MEPTLLILGHTILFAVACNLAYLIVWSADIIGEGETGFIFFSLAVTSLCVFAFFELVFFVLCLIFL